MAIDELEQHLTQAFRDQTAISESSCIVLARLALSTIRTHSQVQVGHPAEAEAARLKALVGEMAEVCRSMLDHVTKQADEPFEEPAEKVEERASWLRHVIGKAEAEVKP